MDKIATSPGSTVFLILVAVFVILAATLLFVLLKKYSGEQVLFKSRQMAKAIVDQARAEADRLINDAQQKARERQSSAEVEFEQQNRNRNEEHANREHRLAPVGSFRRVDGPAANKGGRFTPDVDLMRLLKERFVRGEIPKEEYRDKLEVLTGEHNKDEPFDVRVTFQGIGPRTVLKGRYEIFEEIGRGGIGVVYKASDLQLATVVAVKVLNDELARDGRSVRNLMEEAKISMRLTHPHIMRLINFESDDRSKFLVMEFINGETLEGKLAREGKIAEPALVQIVSDICEGLGYAHKQKIIHRDIKPSNVMLTAGGEVKIMDFGIARVMKDSMTMVTGRMTTGTLIYMSPEQIEGRGVDGRSDLYSLGIMLYELAAGTPPFYQGDITHQHLKATPKPINTLSPQLNEIILKCLEKDKSKRYGSADELRAALERR